MKIEELKELCEKATPGPWIINSRADMCIESSTGRGIASSGGYYNNIDPVRVSEDNIANARFIAASREAVPSLINQLAALRRENEDLKADVQKRKDYKYQEMLEWRSIEPDMGDKPCRRCNGRGVALYGSTSTWRGGIGGQAMTSGICDQCWGSGNSEKPWADLRQIAEDRKGLRDKHYRECEEIAEKEAVLFQGHAGDYDTGAYVTANRIAESIARAREGK